MSDQIAATRPKDKKGDKKRKRDDSTSKKSKADTGLGLIGEKKDAELDDIFGKSVCLYMRIAQRRS